MDVKIKSIGWNQGTSGWLKSEIEAGRMWFAEGVSKSGRHGLYLYRKLENGKTEGQPMALYNPYDLSNAECQGSEEYQVLDMTGCTGSPRSTGNYYDLTPAAIRSVQAVAEQWCEKRNSERERDSELTLTVTFEGGQK